ncbi:MAG: LamG-like jellyroll fold domain-containing protein, partial [Candidatus Micrarchaeia archaeon]
LWLNPNTNVASKTLITASKLTTDSSSRPVYGNCTGTVIPLNHWTHIVVISDGANVCKIYQNGKQTASSTTGVSFGTSVNIGAASYIGLIDEVKIYNYALSEDEIKQEYNRGSAIVLGSLSDTSALSGGSVASNSASAEYCVPGSSDYCAPPVAEWKFDEKQGQYAYDISGNGNSGTLMNGPSWTQGKIGSALSFDGVDDYVQMNTITSNSITYSFWFKNPMPTIDYPQFFTNGTGGYPGPISAYAHVLGPAYGANKGKVVLFFFNTSGTRYDLYSNNILPYNTWHHLEGVYDANNNKAKLYIDGILNVELDTSGNLKTPSGYFRMGSMNLSPYEWFKGLIDNFKIYNYARTPAQIAWDYNRGAPIAHWKFDECQGTTAYDSSGNNNNGTITIGASGSQTSAGTCTSSGAWYNGVNGKFNASLNFDGTDDYVATGNIALITADSQNYSNVSWAAWVKATNNQTGKTLIHKGGEFRLYTDSNGYPTCQVGDTGNTAVYSSTLPNNTWSHLICTYDGSNIKLYLNGSQVASNSRTGSITSSNSTNVNIGQRSNASERYAGQIDDVRIYNYALTPVQIKNLYNESSAIRFGQ